MAKFNSLRIFIIFAVYCILLESHTINSTKVISFYHTDDFKKKINRFTFYIKVFI